ncbi:MAG: Cytochrome d ubiquinol oxidase subunit II [Rhodanobacteraceae bacterium]|jgi:cytochrome d ubiquinol oxidase subunit II|nr:MAG: Cytochrome d ubiquinol oxidase subunit II [Rhodanobacteraceae bacterium]
MELYAILQIVWWLLLGVLLVGLAVMVGMDMGVGTILRWVGRNDVERRVALNIIGPHWDGNQVWFILGGGAVFAAFPLIYATAFSGFYVVMLLLLWAMIVRPLGFEYRGKIADAAWRNAWDWSLFVSGAVPMIVFGAAIGNLFHGVPFHFEWNLTSVYTGSFLALLNPFAILCGVLSLALSVMMGALTIMNGAEGAMRSRALGLACGGAIVAFVLFAIGGLWVNALDGYQLAAQPGAGVPQTPLQQTVTIAHGAWMANFTAHPVLWLVPAAGFLGMLGALLAALTGRSYVGWWLGALAWLGVIGSAGVALFPFLLPSSSDPSMSLTLWNASSSRLTLAWMLGFTVVFVPLVIWYTGWAFWVMRGKVTPESIEHDEHAY